MNKISLPGKLDSNPQNIEIEQSIVIIGANGSGKTRFSAQIESGFISEVHRITALKNLEFPAVIKRESVVSAEHLFRWGVHSGAFGKDAYPQHKVEHRYQNDSITKPLNDFPTLLSLLFAYHQEKQKGSNVDSSKLETVLNIWESIVTQKKLEIDGFSIKVISRHNQDQFFNAKDMSDGERAIFYLIGSILCAHSNALIVVDEPEINLHKSIIIPLWNKLEHVRSDCKFIYLTHDFEFALSRNRSKKIWIKNYIKNNLFDYEILIDNKKLPSGLYLKVLGSAKTVVFIEGDFNSIDYKLYSSLFPNIALQPCGNCAHVIANTKVFQKEFDFHHIYSYGIIDRDRRNEQHIDSLKEKVFVLKVAESENILLTEIVLELILKSKNLPIIYLSQIKKIVVREFEKELKQQTFAHTKFLIKKKFDSVISANNLDMYIRKIEDFKSDLKVDRDIQKISEQFQEYIDNNNYNSILTVFNCKGLLKNLKVLKLLQFSSKEDFINSTKSILSNPLNHEEVNNLKAFLKIEKIVQL